MNAEIGQGHGYEPGVGALLRASRLRCGEELQDIAALLRIRYPFLEAIEDGRYHELPGSAYAIGFVRTYAEHLGLDSEEVVRRFKAEAENLERRSDLVFPSPIAERSTPGGAIIFVGILMAAVAYGAWYLGTSKQSFLDDLVSPLPDRLTALIRGDGEVPATAPSTAPSDTPSSAPASAPEAPAATTPTPEPAPAPTPPAGQTAASPAETPAPTAAPPEPAAKTVPAPSPQPPVASKPVTVPPPTPTPPAVAPTIPAAPTAAPAEPPRTPPVARVEPPASAPATPPAPAVTTPPAASAPSEAPASPPVAPPAAPPAPPSAPVTAPTQPPVPPAATADGSATEQTATLTATPTDTSSRIVVRAKLDSWIQVRDGVGRRLLVTRLLRAGETYQVPNQPSLSLLTGNAGGLEILVDGEPVPAIGDVGTVRRDVTLEADRLKAGTAVVD